MAENDWLAAQFEAERTRLEAVAFRMLGSPADADDAVQEAWLRLSRAGADGIENLGGWLTTVVARVCLDMLRSRKSRREDPVADDAITGALPSNQLSADPEHEVLMADSVGLAMLVVLETLSPAERVAFVLHDMFDLPFDEIAPIVGREPAAARQLASRARRRVRGADKDQDADVSGQRRVVEAFLTAAREGDFTALLELLDPDVVLHADTAAVEAARAAAAAGAPPFESEIRGARAVATAFAGRAQAAQLAFVGDSVGAVYAPGGIPRAAFRFTIANGRIVGMDVIASEDDLANLAPSILTS
ncbi:MAG TPA: sigma-70 family RNA polymerase sigma factor [Tepidiformaceae bacterium]|nr:sigma-70 family RNA polymerase sigma factor [Tepidiformaceae bacterium]